MVKTFPPNLLQRLHQSLLQAYPHRSDFAQFLFFQLEVRLDEITSATAGMSTVHFEVLQWFLARNRLAEFVQEASANRPQNEELAALYAEIVQHNQLNMANPAIVQKGETTGQHIPGWVFAIAGVIFLALLAWVGVQLVGRSGIGPLNVNQPEAESTIAISSADEAGTNITVLSSPTPTSRLNQTSTQSPITAGQPIRTPTPTWTPSPLPISSPNPLPADANLGDSWVRPIDEMEMVFVPAGSFMMGSEVTDPDADEDEFPQHQVALDAFWMDQTEVTNAQFAAFLNENGNQEGGGVPWLNLGDANAHITREGNAFQVENFYTDYPVILVNWYGAAAYCAWVGGRLPTEAEWEYAARGPAGNLYPWGNDQPTCLLAGYGLCVGTNMMAVGSFSVGASWVGALDMAGNVWEWVNDDYDPNYYANSPAENPLSVASSGKKVRRGGGWSSLPNGLRAAIRENDSASNRFNYVGFRCMVPQTG